MAARGIIIFSIVLFVGIAALVLHLLAICSPTWKVSKRVVDPVLTPASYGIWERCEYTNVTVIKQLVTVGTRVDVLYCFPNHYMRYTPKHFTRCHNIRRNCPVSNKETPAECQCNYLSSTKALQWLTIIAAVFISLGLILLYLRIISSAGNNSAAIVLGYGPFLCFLLALILMGTGLIIFCAYFRRDVYEDNSFPILSVTKIPRGETHNLHSLQNYAKSEGVELSPDEYIQAEKELRSDANTHFRTVLGRAAIYEIIATGLILLGTALTFWLSTLKTSEDKI